MVPRRCAGCSGARGGGVALTILQNPAYHNFADQRTLFGIPNFFNVVSNLPFLLVALWGLRGFASPPGAFREKWERAAYAVLLAGIALTAFGSTYYHLQPNNARLIWDRLPMTIIFMSVLDATIGERVEMQAGRRLLVPLLVFGSGSIAYWRWSGNVLLYGVVQFGAILAIFILIAVRPPQYSGAGYLWGMLVLYGLALICDVADHQLAAVLPSGGHFWKHLLAAGALLSYIAGVSRRRPVKP